MRALAACLGLGLAVITASPAASAQTSGVDGDTGRPRREWYGWQILAGDGVVIGLGALGMYGGWKLDESPRGGGVALCALGPIAHMLSGPVVHFANDRPWIALASFALRLGSATPGFALGSLFFLMSKNGSNDGLLAFALGYMVGAGPGILASTAIDAAVLARKPMSNVSVDKASVEATAWPERGGASVGVVGRF